MSRQQNWVKLIWSPGTSPQREGAEWKPHTAAALHRGNGNEKKGNNNSDWERGGLKEGSQRRRVWRRDKKNWRQQKRRAVHRCETPPPPSLGQNPPDWSSSNISVYETIPISRTPPPTPPYLFPPKSLDAVVKACTPPLSELWLFSGGGGLWNIKLRPAKDSPRGKDGNTSNGTLVDIAKKTTITGFHLFFGVKPPNREERVFSPVAVPPLQTSLISPMRWPSSHWGRVGRLKEESRSVWVGPDEVWARSWGTAASGVLQNRLRSGQFLSGSFLLSLYSNTLKV